VANKKSKHEKPVKSNRGRPDARGVFVIFERDDDEEQTQEREQTTRDPSDDDADQPLTRDRS
jgi:hypothetical protein